MTQISIPSSVTEIGNDAFLECSSLTQISIPSSVTKIGKYAFLGCSSLAKDQIPSFLYNDLTLHDLEKIKISNEEEHIISNI